MVRTLVLSWWAKRSFMLFAIHIPKNQEGSCQTDLEEINFVARQNSLTGFFTRPSGGGILNKITLISVVMAGIFFFPAYVLAEKCTENEMQIMGRSGLSQTRIQELCKGLSGPPVQSKRDAFRSSVRTRSQATKNKILVCQKFRTLRDTVNRSYEQCERSNQWRKREDDTRRRQTGHLSDPGFNPPFQLFCQGYATQLEKLNLKIASHCE